MKFGINEVLNVTIFDKDGNIVTTLDTLSNSRLRITETYGTLIIKDALLDKKFLEFIGKVDNDESSDFDKFLKKSKYGTTITFGKNLTKECKIIGEGIMRNLNGLDTDFIFEIPRACTGRDFEFDKYQDEVSDFDFEFTFFPYNDQGDLLKMHIE